MNEQVRVEQEYFLSILSQMKQMHSENKSVKSTLEFIEDCVRNRMEIENET